MQRKTIKTYTRIFSGIVIVWAGPCGVPGHGRLSVSPVSCLQGIDFSLHDLPGVPKRRFKQLLSGKRGCRDQGGGRQDRGRSNGSKGIQPVHPKGNQPWLFTGRTDAEAEAPVLWPPDAKSWLIGKELDAGKDWRQEETGTTEHTMAGWHHWLSGHEFETVKDRAAWHAAVHGVAKSRTQLSEWRSASAPGCSAAQSCPTLYNPIDCSLPGSSAHGIS